MKRVVNGIFVVLGFISLAIGIVGIVLPILPTVPFLIGAVLCFSKGSQRFHKWFLGTKLYKNNLESLVVRKAMTMKKKRNVLIFVTALLAFAWIMMPKWWLRLILAAVLIGHYYAFLFRIETMTEEEEAEWKEIMRQREQNIADGKTVPPLSAGNFGEDADSGQASDSGAKKEPWWMKALREGADTPDGTDE